MELLNTERFEIIGEYGSISEEYYYKYTIDKELKELIEKLLGADIMNYCYTKKNKDGNYEIIVINYSTHCIINSIFETENIISTLKAHTGKGSDRWWINE
tara:strand:+ start:1229 stop:1528 length:300 start_codon:yes stop_codon:yes gene_type:complete